MSEWRECRLADVCSSIDYGFTASASPDDVGPKFLRITDIVGTGLTWSSVPHVQADEKTAQKYRLDDGDIVIARTGATTGESCYISEPPPAVFASYLVRLKVNEHTDARFIAYWLKSPSFYGYLRGVLGDKSAQPNASASTMTNAPIRLPSDRSGQMAISSVLAALDDKIELNRRMNETLEAMAQAIFRDWFVDFGPVRRKLAGETDPVAVMGGLTPDPARAAELAALFPEAFGDGGVPESWRVATLGEYADLNPESWNARNHPDEVEYVDLSNTKWGVIEGTVSYKWAEAPSRARRVVRAGDTLVGTVRPGNGSYSYVGEDGLTASTGFAHLRPKVPVFADIVYLAATSEENIQRLSLLADGGAYPAVNAAVVLGTACPAVPEKLAAAFASVAGPLRLRIEHNKAESRTLAETRDYLLPRLMSGEVRASGDAISTEAA